MASLEECETPELIRQAVGGACVQKDVSVILAELRSGVNLANRLFLILYA